MGDGHNIPVRHHTLANGVGIGPVEACLLEFLDHHSALYLERAFAEVEGEHAVAFDMECRGYDIPRRNIQPRRIPAPGFPRESIVETVYGRVGGFRRMPDGADGAKCRHRAC